MSQLCYSVSSRCFIFSVIFSVLICQTTARHRFTHNNLLREQGIREKSLENAIKGTAKLLRHLLRPSSTNHHEDNSLNQWSQKQEEAPPSDNIEYNTSCGRINCENVTNYPFDLIKDLFAKTRVTPQEIVPASENDEDDEYEYTDDVSGSEDIGIPRSVARSRGGSSSWLYPDEYNPDDFEIPRTENECKHLANKIQEEQIETFVKIQKTNKNICERQIKETMPQETVDRNNQGFTLVNGGSVVVHGYECAAGVFCLDPVIGCNSVVHCKTNWICRNSCVLNNERTAIVKKRVVVANGCLCTEVTLPMINMQQMTNEKLNCTE